MKNRKLFKVILLFLLLALLPAAAYAQDEPVTDDEPGPITEPEDTGGVWAQLGHPELDTTAEDTTDR